MTTGCPIKNPILRTRALIAFEAMRLLLVLAIIIWWGWLLVDKTRYILALEGELSLQDAHYIPAMDDRQMLFMITSEAITLITLVLASSLFSFWLAMRDIRRTRALQGFFASMAHELRTPLASIRLQTEVLAAKYGESPYLSRLQEDVSRFESQLERGLELARSESGKALTLTAVDLAELWQCGEYASLQLSGAPAGKVWADAHALHIIFRNIVENAQIHGKATALSIKQWASGNNVELVFQDNGKGCTETKELGRLFFKGRDSKSTGVGLYLIGSLMKQMGGSATFSGGEGFTVTLIFRGINANA